MPNSIYLNKLLDEVGGSIHSINTIAVSLSHISSTTVAPDGLNITWKPVNVSAASKNARRFAIRSALVFHAEMLFEYLSDLSKDAFWKASGKNFNIPLNSQDSKARRVSAFCKDIPGIEREWLILTELMCHWRNKIVHAKSNAQISASNRKFLLSQSRQISKNYYHFDVEKAIDDFRADTVTLKEVTTLTTFLIKCCRAIDAHYLSLANNSSADEISNVILENREFKVITKQPSSPKKSRQVRYWVEMNYSIFNEEVVNSLIEQHT